MSIEGRAHPVSVWSAGGGTGDDFGLLASEDRRNAQIPRFDFPGGESFRSGSLVSAPQRIRTGGSASVLRQGRPGGRALRLSAA